MTFLAEWQTAQLARPGTHRRRLWKKEGDATPAPASSANSFPINTNADLLHWCRKTGMSISDIVMENESAATKPTQNRRQ